VLTEKHVRRFDNVGDQGCCDVKNVLPHGARWSHGPFTCDSAEAGLTCKRADGRGFFVGRADVKVCAAGTRQCLGIKNRKPVSKEAGEAVLADIARELKRRSAAFSEKED
jgi:hypothetical protein